MSRFSLVSIAVGWTKLCILLSVTYFWWTVRHLFNSELRQGLAYHTGKQPFASGGRSAIRTGRSFRFVGRGRVGGTVTSSKVYREVSLELDSTLICVHR